jgi:hypothetical protein
MKRRFVDAMREDYRSGRVITVDNVTMSDTEVGLALFVSARS